MHSPNTKPTSIHKVSRVMVVFFAFILGLTDGCVRPVQQAKQSKPNILFILIDDLGWADIGAFGNRSDGDAAVRASPFYETPNVDALAKKGVMFTNGYAACPVCSPTRASIMTGKYPARLKATDWFGAPQPNTVGKHWTKNKPLLPAPYEENLALSETTLAETLKANGYTTFIAGKWHLGETEEYWPEKQGFDINKGGYSSGSPRGKGYFAPYNNPRLTDGPVGEDLTDRLANETVSFIRENKLGPHSAKPFFAYLSMYSVHMPLQAPQALIDKYTEKKKRLGLEDKWGKEDNQKVRLTQCLPVYGAMIESMDAAVGKVLTALRDNGVEQETIVVFMSDNGGLSTAEGQPTSNLPLRAGKGWLYEGGIREPMIIYWPGVSKTGLVSNQVATSTDFYPTLLEMAGLPQQPSQHADGVSLVPALKGKKMARGPIYWHYPHYGNQGGSPGSAVRDGDWKLIEWFEEGRQPELFNLKTDVGEQTNLAKSSPAKLAELQRKLNDWRKSVEARIPAKNPASTSDK